MVQYCEHWAMPPSILYPYNSWNCILHGVLFYGLQNGANFRLFQIFRHRRQNAVVIAHVLIGNAYTVHVLCAYDTFGTMESNEAWNARACKRQRCSFPPIKSICQCIRLTFYGFHSNLLYIFSAFWFFCVIFCVFRRRR